VIWHALDVRDVLVVDENFRDSELWDSGHTALLLLVHSTAEAAGPIECVEEANHNVAADSFFDTL
jgi:hypothetical protein